MCIRRAEEKDSERIMHILGQVLEVHASIRPDLFIPGTTKYTREELREIIRDDKRPIYVAVDDTDQVLGYVFCVLTEQPKNVNMLQFTSIYIDDLCVDETYRCQGIATLLFEHVKEEAKRLGCREITLNVWEGNDRALRFYEDRGFKPMKTFMEYVLEEQRR